MTSAAAPGAAKSSDFAGRAQQLSRFSRVQPQLLETTDFCAWLSVSFGVPISFDEPMHGRRAHDRAGLRARLFLPGAAALVAGGWLACAGAHVPVTEVAPRVFVREFQAHSSNQSFVVFDDYVVVFDPGSVEQARLLLEEIRARTPLPVRFAIVSHFHPDHAAGAPIFEAEGAEVLAGAGGRSDFEGWARRTFDERVRDGWKGYEGLEYPTIRYLDEPLILDDGHQHMEVRHYGHGHTSGDLIAWLPGPGVLLTADVCNNGILNLANASTAGWIEVLDQLVQLPVKIVVPGHGALGGPELFEPNRRFLVELRAQVGEMVARGWSLEQVLDEVAVPFYEAWTGEAVRDHPMNVGRVYGELGGTQWPEPRLLSPRRVAAGLAALGAVGGTVWFLRRRQRPADADAPAEGPTRS